MEMGPYILIAPHKHSFRRYDFDGIIWRAPPHQKNQKIFRIENPEKMKPLP